MIRKLSVAFFVVFFTVFTGAARAAGAPAEIKIGTLYASSGAFASISMPVHHGLKMWVDQNNAEGGVFVKPFNKKIPIKLISYDDQSNTATAATLYNQLITQDKVDLLVADSGSVLTSVGSADRAGTQDVPVRRVRHRRRVFHQGQPVYRADGRPGFHDLAEIHRRLPGPPMASSGIKTVAILYATNDFTGTQANAVRGFIKAGQGSEDRLRPGRADHHVQLHGADQQHPRRQSGCGDRISATPATTSPSCATCRTAATNSVSCSTSIRAWKPKA